MRLFARRSLELAAQASSAVDRLKADHELIPALPEGLRNAIAELKPSAPVNLRGNLKLARGAAENAPLTSEWDLTADLHQMTLEAGVKLENIYGDVRLAGGCDGQKFYAARRDRLR